MNISTLLAAEFGAALAISRIMKELSFLEPLKSLLQKREQVHIGCKNYNDLNGRMLGASPSKVLDIISEAKAGTGGPGTSALCCTPENTRGFMCSAPD